MSITSEQLAQITARADVGRAGTMRAACAPRAFELKANGEIIWNRATATDGDPDDTASTWVTGRE